MCLYDCMIIWLWHYKRRDKIQSRQSWKSVYQSYNNMWRVVRSLDKLLLNQVVADSIVRSSNATHELFLIELTWYPCYLYLLLVNVNKNEWMLSSNQSFLVSLPNVSSRITRKRLSRLTGKLLWALPRNTARRQFRSVYDQNYCLTMAEGKKERQRYSTLSI